MSRWISVLKICQFSGVSSRNVYSLRHNSTSLVSGHLGLNSFLQYRYYAKGKDKRKDKGKKVSVNEDEIAEVVDLDKLKADLTKPVDNLKEDYLRTLSLRSTTGAIDSLQINLDGKKVDMMEIARIIHSTPGTVILDMAAHSHAIPLVVKAIEKSGMNLNPKQDGSSVYVPIPRVTKEYRETLCKNAKAMFIKCRDDIKFVQNKFLKILKSKAKEGISEDTVYRVSEQIMELGHIQVGIAEKMLEKKQKELLE